MFDILKSKLFIYIICILGCLFLTREIIYFKNTYRLKNEIKMILREKEIFKNELSKCVSEKATAIVETKKANIKFDSRLLNDKDVFILPKSLNQFLDCELQNINNLDVKC